MNHRKTCKRYNDPGHAHALIFSCFQRQPFLCKDRSRQWLIDAIDRARAKHRFHVWAYVIMPEHAHLLVWPTVASYDISEILNSPGAMPTALRGHGSDPAAVFHWSAPRRPW